MTRWISAVVAAAIGGATLVGTASLPDRVRQ